MNESLPEGLTRKQQTAQVTGALRCVKIHLLCPLSMYFDKDRVNYVQAIVPDGCVVRHIRGHVVNVQVVVVIRSFVDHFTMTSIIVSTLD